MAEAAPLQGQGCHWDGQGHRYLKPSAVAYQGGTTAGECQFEPSAPLKTGNLFTVASHTQGQGHVLQLALAPSLPHPALYPLQAAVAW